MTFKQFTMACAAAGMIVLPAERATAGSGDFAAGIVAGVIGSAVVRNAQPRTQRVVRKKRVYRQGIPSTSEGAQLQTALNYFGYNAGRVDGQVGQGTRNAVSRYQASMGYVADGRIDPPEQSLLIGAYNWAVNGGTAVAAGLGGAALLRDYQQRLATNTLYNNQQQLVTTQPAQPALPQATTVTVMPQIVQPQPAPAPVQTLVAATPVAPSAATPAPTALPTFMEQSSNVSLASHCNQISLVTSTNGGFTKADNLTDANFVLNEQFCLARTYAISEGEQLVANVQGFSPAQIQAQCEAFGPALQGHIASLSQKPVEAVMQEVGAFVLNSGLSPDQLKGTAKICLSVGYRIDNMDVAIGSGLLLATLGETPYAELMGHHLAQGFGASKRPDLSVSWFEMGIKSVEDGAPAVFAPGQPERSALLRQAAYMVGKPQQSGIQSLVQPVAAAPALPTFKVDQ